MRRRITKLYAAHVRKYVHVMSKRRYYKTPRGKIIKSQERKRYYEKEKQIPYYKEKRKCYNRKYNQKPEVKKYRNMWGQIHRSKPHIKKQQSEYSKKRRLIPEVKERQYKKQKEWQKNNPKKMLISYKRHLEKCAIPFKLPYWKYRMALLLWGKSVKKSLSEKCIVCGSTDKLNAHHILYKALYPELSLNINNGVPLCKEHHLEVHKLNPIVRGI